MRLISGTLRSTPLPWLPVLSNIEPPALRRKAATDKLVEKIVKRDSWPMQPDILSPPLLRLTSRKPLWLDLQPVDIKSRWRHNLKSAQVVNSHLVWPHNPATGFRPPSATVVSADEDAVSWLTSYGSWHAYEKKINKRIWHRTKTEMSPAMWLNIVTIIAWSVRFLPACRQLHCQWWSCQCHAKHASSAAFVHQCCGSILGCR